MNHETNEKPMFEKTAGDEVMEYDVFQLNLFH